MTLSNEYGSGAVAIARRAAAELHYEVIDRQLPVVVAKRLKIPLEEVESNEDTGRTLGERWLTSLELATPELAESSIEPPFDKELLLAVQDAVREYASHDDVLIIGRGAGLILGRDPRVLRVFMHAPREWRIAHVSDSWHVDRKTAESEVDRVDRARAAYLRDWYGARFGEPHDYDLCIDTSCFDEIQAALVIVNAARLRGA